MNFDAVGNVSTSLVSVEMSLSGDAAQKIKTPAVWVSSSAGQFCACIICGIRRGGGVKG